MSGTITQIRTALAGSLATVHLRASSLVPDQVNPPMAVVYRKGLDYHLDLDGGATYHFGVSVYATRSSDRTSQDYLDALCEPAGTGSLPAAVEGDGTLNGLCDWVNVVSVGPTQAVTVGAVEYLTVEFTVDLVAGS